MRAPTLRIALDPDELIVDNFAGGGGASLGIEWALGRSPDIAINHDPEAIAMHAANHPATRHYCEDVWQVDPVEACQGRPVALAWFSPDCKHFSKAKGGKPVDKRIRALAWVVIRWAKAVRPRVILLENVEEFEDWGPLLEDGRPCRKRMGLTFRIWVGKLRALGYQVEWRELVAADYGAPTTRKRLFLVARCDGAPIRWPEPTHGPGRAHPWRTAAECIDWRLPTFSIFLTPEEAKRYGVRRPLAANTERRIARGLKKFVLDNPRPFIVPYWGGVRDRAHSIDEPLRTLVPTQNGAQLVAAFLAKHFGGNETPGWPLEKPMSAITARDHHALVASSLVKLKGTSQHGQQIELPLHTVQAGGNHYAEIRAFLLKYYGTDQDPRLEEPMHTLTSRDRMALVMVRGEPYVLADIGMRMLAPRELYRAQGFPDSYIIDRGADGRAFSKEAQVRMVGNSVCPPIAAAIVRANLVEAEAEMGECIA